MGAADDADVGAGEYAGGAAVVGSGVGTDTVGSGPAVVGAALGEAIGLADSFGTGAAAIRAVPAP